MGIKNLRDKIWNYSFFEYFVIVGFAVIPLFTTFPYRVNIFLTWEGAFRMSQGQIPFRDFGIPMGGMFWVVPALFFKVFGPQMITLIKAQVFLNILAGVCFRSILRSFKVPELVRALSVFVFVISYSFFNFWPWYNHSVIVYQLISLSFLMSAILVRKGFRSALWLCFAGLFSMISLFTKQDAGAMGILISLGLTFYFSVTNRNWKPFLYYLFFTVLFISVTTLLFYKYNISYWFNLGQAPHSTRVSGFDILEALFSTSQWLKFYFILVVIIIVYLAKGTRGLLRYSSDVLFFILVSGIFLEALIFQVTSYTPPDNNIFFHSFAIAFILSGLQRAGLLTFFPKGIFVFCVLAIFLWWGDNFWKYFQRIFASKSQKEILNTSGSVENIVNRKTFMIKPNADSIIPSVEWKKSQLYTLKDIYLPKPTIDGIERLFKNYGKGKDLKVLNMTELTSLAYEFPFKLEQGSHYPLWYHLGVGMFNKQADMFEERIVSDYYDLVLFEYIPTLNNFYPFRTRDVLQKNYARIDSFMAPRRGETIGNIEVYVRKQ